MLLPKIKLLFGIIFCSLLLFTSCNHSATKITKPNGIKRFVIEPATTNPQIEEGLGNYYAFQPSGPNAKARLFIFLPGSLVDPKIYQQILLTGAENGYYSIGLSYYNERTFTAICRGKGPDCQGNISRELLEGGDYTDELSINRTSSMEARLITLIEYLEQQHPDRGWGQFVHETEIQWNQIYIAGHSQGSNHAAYIGWHRPVVRVSMFSGPRGIADENGPIASWLQDERKTPASRFYGFGNTEDPVTDFKLMKTAWKAMGLNGPVVSVDEHSVPFQHSHQLSTSVSGRGVVLPAHGSTCVDSQTPMENNKPVFEPVWEYMLFP